METTKREEVFDWLAEEQRHQRAEVAPRNTGAVNPVTGHGRDCMCSRCPGWYDRRAEAAVRGYVEYPDRAPTPDRRGSVLLDQVIPVCCLLAMVTVCGLVLLPVVVPLMAISAMMIVTLALVIVAGAVAVIYTVGALKRQARRDERQPIRGEVVRRRWR